MAFPRSSHARRIASCLLLCTGLSSWCACDDPAAAGVASHRAALQAALLAGDGSQALHLATAGLDEAARAARAAGDTLREDPALLLGAAEACLLLRRFDEAEAWARRGLALPDLEAAHTADLNWVLGKASLGLFLELHDSAAWRVANAALERGAAADGQHRADAAYALMRMQDLDAQGSPERRAKFGRMFLELEPEGERATAARKLLEGALPAAGG